MQAILQHLRDIKQIDFPCVPSSSEEDMCVSNFRAQIEGHDTSRKGCLPRPFHSNLHSFNEALRRSVSRISSPASDEDASLLLESLLTCEPQKRVEEWIEKRSLIRTHDDPLHSDEASSQSDAEVAKNHRESIELFPHSLLLQKIDRFLADIVFVQDLYNSVEKFSTAEASPRQKDAHEEASEPLRTLEVSRLCFPNNGSKPIPKGYTLQSNNTSLFGRAFIYDNQVSRGLALKSLWVTKIAGLAGIGLPVLGVYSDSEQNDFLMHVTPKWVPLSALPKSVERNVEASKFGERLLELICNTAACGLLMADIKVENLVAKEDGSGFILIRHIDFEVQYLVTDFLRGYQTDRERLDLCLGATVGMTLAIASHLIANSILTQKSRTHKSKSPSGLYWKNVSLYLESRLKRFGSYGWHCLQALIAKNKNALRLLLKMHNSYFVKRYALKLGPQIPGCHIGIFDSSEHKGTITNLKKWPRHFEDCFSKEPEPYLLLAELERSFPALRELHLNEAFEEFNGRLTRCDHMPADSLAKHSCLVDLSKVGLEHEAVRYNSHARLYPQSLRNPLNNFLGSGPNNGSLRILLNHAEKEILSEAFLAQILTLQSAAKLDTLGAGPGGGSELFSFGAFFRPATAGLVSVVCIPLLEQDRAVLAYCSFAAFGQPDSKLPEPCIVSQEDHSLVTARQRPLVSSIAQKQLTLLLLAHLAREIAWGVLTLPTQQRSSEETDTRTSENTKTLIARVKEDLQKAFEDEAYTFQSIARILQGLLQLIRQQIETASQCTMLERALLSGLLYSAVKGAGHELNTLLHTGQQQCPNLKHLQLLAKTLIHHAHDDQHFFFAGLLEGDLAGLFSVRPTES